jgi:competence protein ComEC
MKKKKYLKLIILGLILLGSIILFCLVSGDKRTEIDFLDVGQGDSSLIKLPNDEVILIDGGPDNLVLKRLGENLPFYKRRLDLIILSHPHDDHIMGLLEIIKRYEVGVIIYVGEENNPEILTLFLQKAKDRNIKLIDLKNEINIDYSPECFLHLLNPESLNIKEDDNNSIVAKLNCGSLSAIFSGDNNSAVEAALLKTQYDWSAKILKASHHGSKTANSEAFLQAVKPGLLAVSAGVDNRFGHPNQEVLERAKRLKISIKRTDKIGTIRVFGS